MNLPDLLTFAQFQKREQHPRRSVKFSKLQASAYNFTKSITYTWVFFKFLNYTNGTKSRNASQIINTLSLGNFSQSITLYAKPFHVHLCGQLLHRKRFVLRSSI